MRIVMDCEDLDLNALASMLEGLEKWEGHFNMEMSRADTKKPREEVFRTRVIITKDN